MATNESVLPPAAAPGHAQPHNAQGLHGAVDDAAQPSRPGSFGRDRGDWPATLDELIEQQRVRMFRACSVLACLSHVLLYREDFENIPKGPSFVDLADIAQELVAEAANRLDSIHISKLPRSA